MPRSFVEGDWHLRGKRHSSRERLQQAAKVLFAERGYEATTVADVVEVAKTSYSQFVAHFGDKNGVLSAILSEDWGHVASAIRLAIAKTASPLGKLKLIIDIVLSYLERDAAFRTLFLIEGSIARVDGTPAQHAGFSQLLLILDEVFEQIARERSLAPHAHPQVLRSALLGALEGMLRDQLLQERQHGSAGVYTEHAILAMFSNFLYSALQTGEPVEKDEIPAGEAPVEILDQHWIHRYLELAALALDAPAVRQAETANRYLA
jgi:AcrR family transcriptional regulator